MHLARRDRGWSATICHRVVFVLIVLAAVIASSAHAQMAVPLEQQQVWMNHTTKVLFDPLVDRQDGVSWYYDSYRIPSIVKAAGNNNALIAIAEGRRCSPQDFGDINVVYRVSTDNGSTWGPVKGLVGYGAGAWGNPTAVVGHDGTINLFVMWNAAHKAHPAHEGKVNPCDGHTMELVQPGDRHIYLIRGTVNAVQGTVTWTDPLEKDANGNKIWDLTDDLQPSWFAADGVGPGVGIRKTVAPNAGRLVIPAVRRHIYSDDDGASWSYKMMPYQTFYTNESSIVELQDARILRNDRLNDGGWGWCEYEGEPSCQDHEPPEPHPEYVDQRRRYLTRGNISDGPAFHDWHAHGRLLDPKSQGSMLRYTGAPSHRVLFLSPSSVDPSKRCNMRVRLSGDGGRTWPVDRRLHDEVPISTDCANGMGGYSSMAKTNDYHVAALIELSTSGVRKIELHRFNLPWILEGEPDPAL